MKYPTWAHFKTLVKLKTLQLNLNDHLKLLCLLICPKGMKNVF